MSTPGLPRDGSVLVVGASLAGLRAIETLRTEGFEGTVTLVGDEFHLPYDRPPLSKQVLSGKWPAEKAVLADRHRASELSIHEVLGRPAVRLDAGARSIELEGGEVLTADGVVLACGAAARPLPGTDALTQRDGLFTLRTLDDSLALRAAITASDGVRVVVIGAGFIGAEVASTCAAAGCRVTVLEVLDIPLRPIVGPMLGGFCASLHSTHGVDLRTGVSVAGVRRGDPATAPTDPLVVELGDGEPVPADVVVVGIGVSPNTGWLAGSGLTVDNGVVCDEAMFAADGVVAAGDVASWRWQHDGETEQIRIEHWEVAAQGGMAAARSLLAGRGSAPPFTPVPYFWSDQFDTRFQVIGTPRGDDEIELVDGSLEEGKFVALFGRGGRLRAVMAVGRPRLLMGYRPLLERGVSWGEALAHTV